MLVRGLPLYVIQSHVEGLNLEDNMVVKYEIGNIILHLM